MTVEIEEPAIEVGQVVRNRLDRAWIYAGTKHAKRMARERTGTIVEVPLFARENGFGTVRVRWDSLSGVSNASDDWCMWVHTNGLIFDDESSPCAIGREVVA